MEVGQRYFVRGWEDDKPTIEALLRFELFGPWLEIIPLDDEQLYRLNCRHHPGRFAGIDRGVYHLPLQVHRSQDGHAGHPDHADVSGDDAASAHVHYSVLPEVDQLLPGADGSIRFHRFALLHLDDEGIL